jgi:very-short-patch-repair endonuclease
MARTLTSPGVAARLKSDRAAPQARKLRREMTRAEIMLWQALRKMTLTGTHFRRQAVVGPFIVDFVCHAKRVAIEIDGGIHELADVAARDAEREAFIAGRGYRVLRFSNGEVEGNVGAVVRAIAAAVGADTPIPGPAPRGGGELSIAPMLKVKPRAWRPARNMPRQAQ